MIEFSGFMTSEYIALYFVLKKDPFYDIDRLYIYKIK